jgi:hypothetical protein
MVPDLIEGAYFAFYKGTKSLLSGKEGVSLGGI